MGTALPLAATLENDHTLYVLVVVAPYLTYYLIVCPRSILY